MEMPKTYIPRHLEETALSLARDFPVLTITGPRQSGKTTFVRKVFSAHSYYNLELPDLRKIVEDDPRGFLGSIKGPVILDEIQRVPQLLSYIQVAVDEHPESGRFILTGSHQLPLRAAITQSLAGRTAILKLFPLSMAELADAGITRDRDSYLLTGFLPRAAVAGIEAARIYSSYYQTYVERDVRQLAQIRNSIAFETLIRLLAGRVGQLVHLSDLSNAVGVSATTINEWVSLLEASYIIFRLPPYYNNFGKRFVKSPKIYFTEPALATWLLGYREASHIGMCPFLGGLFENLVVVEALKSRFNGGFEPNLYFIRDNNGLEVDLLLEEGGELFPIEIKAAKTVVPDFAKVFPKLKTLSGQMQDGAIIYSGDMEFQFKGIRLVSLVHTRELFMKRSGNH
jgi:hypothetical protein